MQAIMAALDQLEPGQPLRLIAPFRPEPLFRVLEKRGFSVEAHDQPNGDCEVLFRPLPGEGGGDTGPQEPPPSPLVWPEPELHLDLADLDPPEPMTRILAALEKMAEGAVLFALLSREPLFLYPELTRRGHLWVGNFDAAGTSYRMLIRRGG